MKSSLLALAVTEAASKPMFGEKVASSIALVSKSSDALMVAKKMKPMDKLYIRGRFLVFNLGATRSAPAARDRVGASSVIPAAKANNKSHPTSCH